MSTEAAIQATFINRATKTEYTSLPAPSSCTYNTDLRLFTDSFDFEIKFPRDMQIDVRSHDFVEFFFMLGGAKFQIGVGFIETLKSHAAADGYTFQGNGRDLLGQMIGIPFKENLHANELTMMNFLPLALGGNSYVYEYLRFRNLSNKIVNRGAYPKLLQFSSTAMVNRGAVIEEYADLAMNRVYLDRLGRVTVYGRPNVDDLLIPETITHEGDPNVVDLVKTDDFSKVLSEVTVFFVAGQANVDINKNESPAYKNTDPRVSHIYQPYYKTLTIPDLTKLDGRPEGNQVAVIALRDRVAKSIIRKSNQSIGAIVVRTPKPFYTNLAGVSTPYEIGQNWTIRSESFGISEVMKLVGIGYHQESMSLDVQLAFVGKDTVV